MAEELEIHEPTREQIERRAFEIYMARGGQHGSDVADWIMAEQELKALQANEPTSKSATKSDARAISR